TTGPAAPIRVPGSDCDPRRPPPTNETPGDSCAARRSADSRVTSGPPRDKLGRRLRSPTGTVMLGLEYDELAVIGGGLALLARVAYGFAHILWAWVMDTPF